MVDFPSYTVIKYYLNDKSTVDTFKDVNIKLRESVCAELVLTKDLHFYLHLKNGTLLTPDSLKDEYLHKRLVMSEWLNIEQITFCIKNQPYDIEFNWSRGRRESIYSKDLYRTFLSDVRNFKVDLITNKINKKDYIWIPKL